MLLAAHMSRRFGLPKARLSGWLVAAILPSIAAALRGSTVASSWDHELELAAAAAANETVPHDVGARSQSSSSRAVVGGNGTRSYSEALGALVQVEGAARAAVEPVTVTVLLGIAVVGDAANIAITYARVAEARRSSDALQQAVESMLEEREDACATARSLSFASALLSAETQVFLESALATLPAAAASSRRSGEEEEEEQGSIAGSAVAKNAGSLIAAHMELARKQKARHWELVQSVCWRQQGEEPIGMMRRQAVVAEEISRLSNKVMDDWVILCWDFSISTIFSQGFNNALPEEGAVGVLTKLAMWGVNDASFTILEDKDIQAYGKMLGDGTAPLWTLRFLNWLLHVLNLLIPSDTEVVVYVVRHSLIASHGLVTRTLKTAIADGFRNPRKAFKNFLALVDTSFWLVRNVYRVIYGMGQVVPWGIVTAWAVFKDIRVTMQITENLVGLSQQRQWHKEAIEMTSVEAAQEQLEQRFSSCTAFHRARVTASEQRAVMEAFHDVLEALPTPQPPAEGGTAASSERVVAASGSFGVSSERAAAIVEEVFDGSPQPLLQLMLAAQTGGEPADPSDRLVLASLQSLWPQSRVAEIRRATSWGPITDVAVSDGARHDEVYRALGFFQLVPRWRLWACRGCSQRRILDLKVCFGTDVVKCLEREGGRARERFRITPGDSDKRSVEVMALPSEGSSDERARGEFAELYRARGIRPRLLLVAAASPEAAGDEKVLVDLSWIRQAPRVPEIPRLGKSGSGHHMSLSSSSSLRLHPDRTNRNQRRHALQAKAMNLDVAHAAKALEAQEQDAPASRSHVEVLWRVQRVLDGKRKEAITGMLRPFKPSLLISEDMAFALDIGSATFQPEAAAQGFSARRLLITEGHACHLSAALRTDPFVRRLRTEAKVLDTSTYGSSGSPPLEGWLLDEGAGCAGYQELRKALRRERMTPLTGLDASSLSRDWPRVNRELPQMRCSVKRIIDLATGSVVNSCKDSVRGSDVPMLEDAMLCLDGDCPLDVAKSTGTSGKWDELVSVDVGQRAVGVWVRWAVSGFTPGGPGASAPLAQATKEDQLKSSVRIQHRLAHFESVLAGALCSPEKCHFSRTSEPLPKLLGLPVGAPKAPSYLKSFGSETYFFPGEKTAFSNGPEEESELRVAGMPQLAFYRRRRAKQCATATTFVRSAAERMRTALPTLERVGSQMVKSTDLEWTFREGSSKHKPIYVHHGVAVAAEPTLGFPRPAVEANAGPAEDGDRQFSRYDRLRKCVLNRSAADNDYVRHFSEALAVFSKAKSLNCGFELVVPIVPAVACPEGFGLSVDVSSKGTVTEGCAKLAEQPPVLGYLAVVSLRRLGADVPGFLRRTGQSVEHALTAHFGYTRHVPASRQPRGCILPWEEDEASDSDDGETGWQGGERYVFRQEIWSRRDPRLREEALGTSQPEMCALQERLGATASSGQLK